MSQLPIRVVKVGGSLFGFAEFVPAWNVWLAEQSPAVNVLIAGGGKLADAVREADAVWKLGEEASHWLCIEAMGVSARVLAAVLPEARWEATWDRLLDTLASADGRQPILFSPVQFLSHIEADLPPRPLPHRWSVTSDSIAARLAQVLSASELVLLKSADPAGSVSVSAALRGRRFRRGGRGSEPRPLRQSATFRAVTGQSTGATVGRNANPSVSSSNPFNAPGNVAHAV